MDESDQANDVLLLWTRLDEDVKKAKWGLSEIRRHYEIFPRHKDQEKHDYEWEDGYAKRVYVRVVFTYLEGVVAGMKASVLDGREHLLSIEDRAILSEKDIFSERQRRVGYTGQLGELPQNIKFTFRMYAQMNGGDYEIDTSGGWSALKPSMKVRNRLTHPQNATELDVSDAELKDVERVEIWFKEQMIEMDSNIAAHRLIASGETNAPFQEVLRQQIRRKSENLVQLIEGQLLQLW